MIIVKINKHTSLIFGNQFRYLLWTKIREPKIKEKYSPNNLAKLLCNIDNDKDFDNVLENW